MRMCSTRTARIVAFGAVACLAVSSVNAGISDEVLKVVAQSESGSSTYVLNLKDTGWDYREGSDGVYTWSLGSPFSMVDANNGAVIGTVSELSVTLKNDPQLNLHLSVQSGDKETSFTIMSGKLEFEGINHAVGQASTGFTLTDTNNNGAYVTGSTGPSSSAAFWAAYNGDLPDAQTFSEMLHELKVAPGETSSSFSENDPKEGGYRPIDAQVQNMSTATQFSLSAFDMLSGTSNFEVIPEPTCIAMLALALVASRRAVR